VAATGGSQAALVPAIPPLRAPTRFLLHHRGGRCDAALQKLQWCTSRKGQMRRRGPRPCPAAHTGEHPILAQFFPEGSHGYIRVSIFLDFFVQFRLMVSRWSLGHQREQQHKIRVSPARCRMDLPGPTTSVGTRTDCSVGPWDYLTCAARYLMV
jgi:hypothetical protein